MPCRSRTTQSEAAGRLEGVRTDPRMRDVAASCPLVVVASAAARRTTAKTERRVCLTGVLRCRCGQQLPGPRQVRWVVAQGALLLLDPAPGPRRTRRTHRGTQDGRFD